MNAILTVLCGIALLLFYFNKISSKYVILLIGIYVLSIGSNIEGYDSLSGSTSCDCSGLNSEALQNIASIYNSGELVLNNLTVTGTLKTNTISPSSGTSITLGSTTNSVVIPGTIKTNTLSPSSATSITLGSTANSVVIPGTLKTNTLSPSSATSITLGSTANSVVIPGDTKIAKTMYVSNIQSYSTGSNININADGGQTYFTGGDVHADSGSFHAVNFESNRSDGNFICANRSGLIHTKYLC